MESIKKARKRQGMSLAQVAERCGLFPEAIARAERAGIDPKASTVAKIAKGLGLPVCELYPKSGHEPGRRKKRARS